MTTALPTPLIPTRRPALGVYGMSGYPSPAAGVETLLAYAAAGADVLEVGIPIGSDAYPRLDGHDIATAHRQARGGTEGALSTVERLSAATDVPIVAMAYWATARTWGPRQLARDLAAAGARGALLVSVPPELVSIWTAVGLDAGLHTPLLTNHGGSPSARVRTAQTASGFVYVPAAASTGHRGPIQLGRLATEVEQARKAAPDLPIATGVGLSTPTLAATAVRRAEVDAVIIGSPLMRAAARVGLNGAAQLVADYAHAIREAAQ
ncbi:tryptophan synthase subunit alpha [Streptomyces sp. NPDC090442]|uniref:tryptophan synthase subunit alpha n=1 Tax=Streptomyces sp. NPDC090442 TaxID=3365962 RepID=UPI003826C0B3